MLELMKFLFLNEKNIFRFQNLFDLQKTLLMEKKVEKRLGKCKIL